MLNSKAWLMKKLITLIIIAIIITLIGGALAMLIDHAISILFLPLSFGLAMFVLLSAISVMPKKRTYSKPLFESLLDLKLGDKDTVGYVFVHRLAATIGMGIMFLIIHIYYTTHGAQYAENVSSHYNWTTIIPIELTMTILLLTFALGTKVISVMKKKWHFVGARTIIK